MIAFFGLKRYGGLDYANLLKDQGVKREEVDDCMLWAFGSHWQNIPPRRAWQAWNRKHGYLLFSANEEDELINLIKNIGIAYKGMQDEGEFIHPSMLANLDISEAKFRKILIMSFREEGMTDMNEMMDCISWGLGYDQDLLQCHNYAKWPDAFFKNTGILVNTRDSVRKCIRLLARKWKSKRKISVVRPLGTGLLKGAGNG